VSGRKPPPGIAALAELWWDRRNDPDLASDLEFQAFGALVRVQAQREKLPADWRDFFADGKLGVETENEDEARLWFACSSLRSVIFDDHIEAERAREYARDVENQARWLDVQAEAREAHYQRQTGISEETFEPVDATSFVAEPDPSWLVEDVAQNVGLGQLFAPEGHDKSFIAVDLLGRVGSEDMDDWHGKSILRHGSVVAVVMEGAFGYRRRLRAWAAYYRQELKRLWLVVEKPVNLGSDGAVELLERGIRAKVDHPVLVVIDTQGQATPNVSENDATAMNAVYRTCRQLAVRLDCFVLLVHHTGWDTSRVRGSSAQPQAMDLLLHVEERGLLRVAKVRDAKADYHLAYKTVEVPEEKSLVVVPNSVVKHVLDERAQQAAAEDEAKRRIWQYVWSYPHAKKTAVALGTQMKKADALRRVDELVASKHLRNVGTIERPSLVTSDHDAGVCPICAGKGVKP
jgi:AAA domain